MAILSATVKDFEDVSTVTGEIVTIYIVHVEIQLGVAQASEGTCSYCISKRYSEFKELFESMRQLLPSNVDYRFPKKSMFNNNAQFTKERRLRGFDELLKLLTNHYRDTQRMPPVLQQFLQIRERTNESAGVSPISIIDSGAPDSRVNATASNRRRSGGSFDLHGERERSTVSALSTGARHLSQDPDRMQAIKVRAIHSVAAISVRDGQRENDFETRKERFFRLEIEKELNMTMKRHFLAIVSSSTKVSASVYLLLVFLQVIDTSAARFTSIVTTIAALGLLVSFLRIIFMKFEARKKCVCKLV